MELREYISIIFKNIQLIVIFTLVSLTLTLLFTTQQKPVYESSSTYVARVTPGQGFDDTVYATETLIRQRIYVTFCDVMESGRIREDAFNRLGLDPFDVAYEDYVIECTPQPESNVIIVSVEGFDPPIVQSLNQVVGIAGMEYNNTLFGYIELNLLDNVFFNPVPISPSYLLNGVLGLALGVTISITIVFLLDYLRSPAERLAESSIYEVRLNVYNNRYATRRLQEEIQRSKMQNRLLAVALIDLVAEESAYLEDEATADLLLRQAAMRLREKLRPTDILAHRDGGTFTLIMPETPERTALRLVRQLHENVSQKPVEIQGAIANFSAITGMVENNGGMYDVEPMMDLADRALNTARRAGINTIEFVRTKPSPFVMDDTEIEFFQFNVTDEFEAVSADETEIPALNTPPASPVTPVSADPTQPIELDPTWANPFGNGGVDEQGISALDRVLGDRSGKANPEPKSTPPEERFGPFSVPKKDEEDDKSISDSLKNKLRGNKPSDEDE
ncbi:MAG: hypothetical protein Phog2KO_27030 [Phototrophicaceae bacterium]